MSFGLEDLQDYLIGIVKSDLNAELLKIDAKRASDDEPFIMPLIADDDYYMGFQEEINNSGGSFVQYGIIMATPEGSSTSVLNKFDFGVAVSFVVGNSGTDSEVQRTTMRYQDALINIMRRRSLENGSIKNFQVSSYSPFKWQVNQDSAELILCGISVTGTI